MINTCPKCKKEISYLFFTKSKEVTYFTDLDNQGKLRYKGIGFAPINEASKYTCPECDKTLFTDEKEALNFFLS